MRRRGALGAVFGLGLMVMGLGVSSCDGDAGEMSAPTVPPSPEVVAQARVLAEQMRPLFRQVGGPLRARPMPSRPGAVMVDLNGFQSAHTAVRGPDGKLHIGCVSSVHEAETFFREQGAGVPSATK